MSLAPSDTMLAIRNGEVRGMVIIANDDVYRETMAEWALDPTVEEFIRVPLEVARLSFLEPVATIRKMLAERAK